jgi:hypothetical protein
MHESEAQQVTYNLTDKQGYVHVAMVSTMSSYFIFYFKRANSVVNTMLFDFE